MNSKLAHKIEEKERTNDICFRESTPFSKMLLKDGVRKGLDNCGFIYPTVIQANAIPLGKSGIDLLCQSKSGTGKTLIFCTILLELYQELVREPQSLILVPTREIAIQIEGILNKVGEHLHGFKAVSVIGGLEVTNDRKKLASAKAVVGTPGRVLHLIQNDMLNTSKIVLFVLDEADKMMSKSFLTDFQKILQSLPKKKQMIACSATFCNDLDKKIASYMKNPLLVSTDKGATLLIGIKQLIYDIPDEKTSILEMTAKLRALKKIFSKISFKQCLAFASSQSRAESYKNALEKDGWPCEVITGAQDQKTRIEIFKKFKDFKTRIVISTDLMARGIDSENVNLVLNMEPPDDGATYLHRIGRAGRFGSYGIAITFISNKEKKKFKSIIESVGSGLNVFKYPPNELIDVWNFTSLENENILEPYDFNETYLNNSYLVDKENVNDTNTFSNSANIDQKTYKIEYVDHDTNANKILLTETMSSLQRLPSSNTIDDASSIAVDSDVFRSNSFGSKDLTVRKRSNNNNSMSLLEVLIDNSKSSSTENIDLFEDYKSFDGNLNDSQAISKTEETAKLNLKELLFDKKKPQKPAKDAFREYEKLQAKGDDLSDSNSFSVSISQQYDPTPGSSRVMEELNLKIPDIAEDSSTSNAGNLQKPHFPSPNNLVELGNVHVNNAILPISRSASTNDSTASNASSSYEGVSTSSSGFDERTTSAKTSGISTSSNSAEESRTNSELEIDSNFDDEDAAEEDDDNDNDSFDYNASYFEDQSDEEEDETYQTSDSDRTANDEANVTDNDSNITSKAIGISHNRKQKRTRRGSDKYSFETINNVKCEIENEHQNENTYTNEYSNDMNFSYQNAYAKWTDLYWNQMTQIQDYVKFCTYVHQNTNL